MGPFLLQNLMMQATSIDLPKKPRIKLAEPLPDQRKFIVLPFRAATDYRLTHMQLRVLLVLCSYCNRGGIAWVGSEKIAQMLQREASNITRHLKSLERKGYIKIVCKGYPGQRAHTRQVIFADDITAADAAAVSGEAAPYQVRQQIRDNQGSFNTGGDVMARKKRINVTADAGNLEEIAIDQTIAIDFDNQSELQSLQRSVGSELLAVAVDRAGPGASIDEIRTQLQVMLK